LSLQFWKDHLLLVIHCEVGEQFDNCMTSKKLWNLSNCLVLHLITTCFLLITFTNCKLLFVKDYICCSC